MSCCGQARRAVSLHNRYVTYVHLTTGKLSVHGGVTGSTYVFDGPGARVRIDIRDESGIVHLLSTALKKVD